MDTPAVRWTADSDAGPGAEGWLSVSAAAATLGISQRAIRRAINRGDLPAARRAGRYLIAPADLERYGSLGRVAGPPRLIPVPVREGQIAPDLPRPLTPLIGREHELAVVEDLVLQSGVRLVTLVGPGGVGKTRLALRVAERAAAQFPDEVWFVALAPLRDPAMVASAIARALGIVERADQSAIATLMAVIRDRRMLLVLDNFEHLLAAAPQVAQLLSAGPNLVLLVTSRARLNLSGEHELAVPSLAFSSPQSEGGGQSRSVEIFEHAPAVRLFVARAQAVDAGFRLTEENAAAVASICARVDGLPLAIELAAAQTRLFAPAALLAQLGRRLPLLTGGPRDQPDRLRTMADAIAWSHDLLSGDQKVLFRRLAVFVGGCTLEAAVSVAGDWGGEALDGIAALVDHHLLGRVDQPGGETRFAMLETIREFGLERFTDSGEEAAARTKHALHFLAEAEEANAIFWGRLSGSWGDRLEPDLPNMRSALAWLIESANGDASLRLAAALEPAWWILGHHAEGRRWLRQALALRAGVSDAVVVAALVVAGRVANGQTDHAEAAARGREALALAVGAGVDPAEAIELLGFVAAEAADPALRSEAAAQAHFEEALASYRWRDEPVRTAYTLVWLADLARTAPNADLHRIREQLDEAAAIFRGAGLAAGIATVMGRLGEVARRSGDLPAAARHYREALALHAAVKDSWGVACDFEGMAQVATQAARPGTAARLYGSATVLRDELGLPIPAPHRAAYVAEVASVRESLGSEHFAAAWESGRSCPVEEVLREADDFATRIGRTASSAPALFPDDGSGLSRREREVLALLVEGKVDRDIAEALSISYRTVTNHVASILTKLDAPTRTAAATSAVRRGLA